MQKFKKNLARNIPRVLGLGLFMQQLDSMILNTAIPQMAEALHTPTLSLKLAITSYLLTLAMFIPISGYVADRFGTQKTFALAMLVFLLGSIISGCAFDINFLIIGRLIQGAGAAMITPVGRLILLKAFSQKESLIAYNAYTMIGQMGLVIGPTLGGVLTTFMNWRFIFFVNIPVAIIALFLVYEVIPNYKEDKKSKFDWLGFFLFGAAAGSISFGFSWMSEEGFSFVFPWLLLLVGIFLGLIYYFHAQYLNYKNILPALDLKVFKIRTFRLTMLGGSLFRLTASGATFLLPLQFQMAMGYSAFDSGLMLLPQAASFLISKQCFTWALKKFGFRNILIFSPLLVSLALLGFALISDWSGLRNLNFIQHFIIFGLIMLVLGFFSSIQYSSLNTLIFADVPKDKSSRATSSSGVVQQLGLSLAVCFCAGLLVGTSFVSQTHLLGEASFYWVYLILSFLTFLTPLVFLKLRKSDGMHLIK